MWLEPDSFIYPLASWVYEAHQQVYHINNLFYDAVFGDFFFIIFFGQIGSFPIFFHSC